MIRYSVVIWTLCLLTSGALAEVSAIKVKAVVKSFDEKYVTIQLQKKTIQVPREFAGVQKMKVGETVVMTFRGEQIGLLFADQSGTALKNTQNTQKSIRSPASENNK